MRDVRPDHLRQVRKPLPEWRRPRGHGGDTRHTTGRMLGVLGLAACGLVVAQALNARKPRPRAEPRAAAAAKVRHGAMALAGSVAADSLMEHFRGGYCNDAMYLAPAVAGTALAATAVRPPATPRDDAVARDVAHAASLVTGTAGLAFHVWNIGKRPGGLTSMNNLFYAAPVGAPGGLAASGLYGLAEGRLRRAPIMPPRVEGRLLAGLTALNLLATSAEAGLLHFRGAFQNPFMFVPVTAPPAAALVLGAAAADPAAGLRRLARAACWTTAAAGAAGVAFHAWGVHRNHGGWRNWRQNLIQGPPVAAPPAFVGLGLAGLGALDLMDIRDEGRR
ncbi:hypothetical protein [Tranquillimonas alkanivorans]|uniref:Uncharacterized protein n=1 Tax=Tranquillimonas alkanivorans TaxID=441119 RepID=A0A1I5VMA9_9RHOB|nr:hypothetical protein [Tranquillimonas alkanivorans]SFQ08635.1 hypothetical protein SAMN04488047_13315 [Tranquillimonas alkanivorans]